MVVRAIVMSGLALVCAASAQAWSPAGGAAPSNSGWVSRMTGILSGQPGVGPVTQREADQGLREALSFATAAAADRLGAPGGFLDNPKLHIPLPGALGRAQTRLKAFGMSGPLDELEIKLNRGAEAAMPQAKALVLDAVRSITLGDALAILRGGDTAATTFLRTRTEVAVGKALRPHLEKALTDSGAFAVLDQSLKSSVLQGLAGDARKDITDFALQKALDGLYGALAEEERAIRTDPAKRTTAILKRVFGAGR